MIMQFLTWSESRASNKNLAKTFYDRDDAAWALCAIKIKDGKNTD